jgi:hypothetical protein
MRVTKRGLIFFLFISVQKGNSLFIGVKDF